LLNKIATLYNKKNGILLEKAIEKLSKLNDLVMSIGDLAQLSFEKNIFDKKKKRHESLKSKSDFQSFILS